jgi:cytidylate kinase
MAVITVSRQRGSKGSYIALEVARRMGLRYLDREILDSVAQQAGVEVAELEAIEARAGRLPRVLHLLGVRPKLPSVASASLREEAAYEARIDELVEELGLDRDSAVAQLEREGVLPYQPSQDYLHLTRGVILDYAQEGDAVIVGRGGQMILRRRPGVLHVQVVGKFEVRVCNICEREGVKWREAAYRLREADEERAAYMRRFYGVDWLDPGLYDLVLNTDQIPDEAAVDMIVLAAEAVDRAAGAEATAECAEP